MFYWLNGTGASSARLYWESFNAFGGVTGADPDGRLAVPEGDHPPRPRRWAEPRFTDIRYWNELDRGGHFAAFEEPDLFVERDPDVLPASCDSSAAPSSRPR